MTHHQAHHQDKALGTAKHDPLIHRLSDEDHLWRWQAPPWRHHVTRDYKARSPYILYLLDPRRRANKSHTLHHVDLTSTCVCGREVMCFHVAPSFMDLNRFSFILNGDSFDFYLLPWQPLFKFSWIPLYCICQQSVKSCFDLRICCWSLSPCHPVVPHPPLATIR